MAGSERERVALRSVSPSSGPASEGKRTTTVMPEHATQALYDQDEDRIADWGGDDLFTRMPQPPAVDDAPAPRFRPALTLVEPAADRPARSERAERRRGMTAEEAMHERAERLGLSLVAEPAGAPPATPVADSPWDSAAWGDATRATVREWDAAYGERAPNGRRTKVITGRPDGAPRPLSLVPAERRRPPRTPAEWVGAKPERIVAWAFALGLILILVAISTADAATV